MIHIIGVFGGYRSCAYGVNDRGQVIGISSTDERGVSWAFLWEEGRLGSLGTLGGDWAAARAINNEGVIVGRSRIPIKDRHDRERTCAFAIAPPNNMQGLHGPDHLYSAALDINDDSMIVGECQFDEDQPEQAAFWRQSSLGAFTRGRWVRLDRGRADVKSTARQINARGQIVGNYGQRAVLWDAGRVIDLCEGWSCESTGTGINDNGVVAGTLVDGIRSASFVRDEAGARKLPNPEGKDVSAVAIDNSGRVLANAFVSGDMGSHPLGVWLWEDCKWYSVDRMVPPNQGCVLVEAHAMNNRGQIVGLCEYRGAPRGFLLDLDAPHRFVP